MLNYVIQIILFQALFFIVYELMLKKETFFTGNRIYLLVTQILILVLPFLHFPKLQEIIPPNYQQAYTQTSLKVTKVITLKKEIETSNFQFQWEWVIYFGAFISLILFCLKLYRILKTIKNNTAYKKSSFIFVPIEDNSTAFSFFNYIFIGNKISKNKQHKIIEHELIHVKQKHSLDLLLFEILRILFWFNPLVYLYQKRITEIHEFIVDHEITKNNTEKTSYFETLLSEVFQTESLALSNSFYNHSLIKKRIQMLTKMKSRNQMLLKYLFIVPTILFSLTYVAYSNYIPKLKPTKSLTTLEKSSSNELKNQKTNYNSSETPLTNSNGLKNQKTDYNSNETPQTNSNELKNQKTDYNSSETPECLNIKVEFDYNLDNHLTIENKDKNLDAVVFLIYKGSGKLKIKEGSIMRAAYIRSLDKHDMMNIPKGKYVMKIARGNNWVEQNDNGICKGYFKDNANYSISNNILDFNPVNTAKGLEVPSYQIDINILNVKPIEDIDLYK